MQNWHPQLQKIHIPYYTQSYYTQFIPYNRQFTLPIIENSHPIELLFYLIHTSKQQFTPLKFLLYTIHTLYNTQSTHSIKDNSHLKNTQQFTRTSYDRQFIPFVIHNSHSFIYNKQFTPKKYTIHTLKKLLFLHVISYSIWVLFERSYRVDSRTINFTKNEYM